jgi:methionyl aminopeptidase
VCVCVRAHARAGHGVGRVFHTTPNIVHYKNNQQLGTMQPGHIFTIEPMINEGTSENKVCALLIMD